jgi:hypothetical protein
LKEGRKETEKQCAWKPLVSARAFYEHQNLEEKVMDSDCNLRTTKENMRKTETNTFVSEAARNIT